MDVAHVFFIKMSWVASKVTIEVICVAEASSNNGISSPALKSPVNKQPSVQQLQNQAILLPPNLPTKPDQQQHIKHNGQTQSKKSNGPQLLPGLNRAKQTEIMRNLSVEQNEQFLDESFIEMLIKCQGTRIEEQRSLLPGSELSGIPSESKMI